MDRAGRKGHIQGMQRDVIIVGGGLNGSVLAIALARAGLAVTLVDAGARADQAHSEFDGRSYAMALTSCRMLQHLGIWDALAEVAQPILDIKVSDGRAGEGPSPFVLHFSHGEIEEGPMGHMVEDRHLRPALLHAVDVSGIDVIDSAQVVSHAVSGAGIRVELADGSRLEAHVVLAADGRASATGERAGIKRVGWDYAQTAIVCAVAHEKPHQGVAHQFFMPPGPLAILPLTGNRSSIVWSETAETAQAFLDMSDDDFVTMLKPRFGDFLGDISLAGKRYSYPLSLSLVTRMCGPRMALVGDAAHGVHPIAGQGLNAGMRDIAAVTQVLTEARQRGEDIGASDVLGRYERWRRFDNTMLGVATDGLNRLFSNDRPVLRGLRDLGMGVVGAVPGMRRQFIREAAGLTGDLPRLMQADGPF
jgi:2-octaprenyl-6-methoxyphenol hydroxylase